MSQPLTIAVPSKGRLQENTFAFFARAGMNIGQARGAREYRGSIAGLEGVEIAFLSASEIANELGRGNVHFGITGEDLLEESLPDATSRVEILTRLGFGYANVVVAVPQAWIDVKTMADLEDVAARFHAKHGRKMRVATKYLNITRRYFAAHGIGDYRIVESLGATEGAPAAGTAELIVDITTTGATLAANGLKILDNGTMLKSEACLVASLTAQWSDSIRASAQQVLARIAAEESARALKLVTAWFGEQPINISIDELEAFAAEAPYGLGGPKLRFFVHSKKIAAFADLLLQKGALNITASPMDYIFKPENQLASRLWQRL